MLYVTPNSLKFQTLLIYTTEGSSVHDHVPRGTCAEGAQLRQLNMVARCGHWHRLEVRGFTLFYGRGSCPGLLSCGVVLLHDNVCPHTA